MPKKTFKIISCLAVNSVVIFSSLFSNAHADNRNFDITRGSTTQAMSSFDAEGKKEMMRLMKEINMRVKNMSDKEKRDMEYRVSKIDNITKRLKGGATVSKVEMERMGEGLSDAIKREDEYFNKHGFTKEQEKELGVVTGPDGKKYSTRLSQ